MSPLALHLSERFGRTNIDYITHGEQRRLELLLTDRRWHGLNDVVPIRRAWWRGMRWPGGKLSGKWVYRTRLKDSVAGEQVVFARQIVV
jgi:hypothetical protein